MFIGVEGNVRYVTNFLTESFKKKIDPVAVCQLLEQNYLKAF